MNVSESNSEKFLVLDLLPSNGFKAWNIPTLACHATLSMGMDIYKWNDQNYLMTLR